MANIVLCTITLFGVLALFVYGDWEERLVGVLVLILMVATPLVVPLQIDTWRAGVAGLEAAFLLALLILTYARDRWWLTAITGLQLISLLTHFVSLIAAGRYLMWTAVTIRLEVWLFVCITLFAGAWEAWAARRHAREGGSHDQDDNRPGLDHLGGAGGRRHA